jgi:hypothetical protein
MSGGPTLTDARGIGGLMAQDGFDYQVWDAMARLPAWLAHPGFEGLMIEGLEDFEARFFAPHSPVGHLLDRFQAKMTQLPKAEIEKVIGSFRTFDDAHPKVSRVQTLVTTVLPKELAWLARDPDRVRKARPFYDPFADVVAASDDKLRSDLTETFGTRLGQFFARSVDVQLRVYPTRSTAVAAFGDAFSQAFPHNEVSSRRVAAAFDALVGLADKSRGHTLTRKQLVTELQASLGISLADFSLSLHIRGDQSPECSGALEIDARGFSQAPVPPTQAWQHDLLEPLGATARWAKQQEKSRIILSGQYRLSTALALGWVFRAATGFELEIPTRAGAWATDQRPPSGLTIPVKVVDASQLQDRNLVVAIGVLRDPVPTLLAQGRDPAKVLAMQFDQAIPDGSAAQLVVRQIKDVVQRTIDRLRPDTVDLFYAGPAALAVALGHRWNAITPTQLYEFEQSLGSYTPTAILV